MTTINIYNCDCMEFMADKQENAYDLAIVDPPYGIGEDSGKFRDRKGGNHRILKKKNWDNKTPEKTYFNLLINKTKNQIIWGANYITDKIPVSRGWIYWDKLMGGDYSDGEIAWTSFDKVLKKFTKCNKYKGKIHPTEKPPELYKWLLQNYAKEGDKILDTHGGSMSIAIACIDLGFDLDICELDKDYFEEAIKRINRHCDQMDMFIERPVINIHKKLDKSEV